MMSRDPRPPGRPISVIALHLEGDFTSKNKVDVSPLKPTPAK